MTRHSVQDGLPFTDTEQLEPTIFDALADAPLDVSVA